MKKKFKSAKNMIALRIVKSIMEDIFSRGVLGEAMRNIPLPIKHEMDNTWHDIIVEEAEAYVRNNPPVKAEATVGKYNRNIVDINGNFIGVIDIYSVLAAFNVKNPAIQHAVKKLLCAGVRGKGDFTQDIKEAAEAVSQAPRFNVL